MGSIPSTPVGHSIKTSKDASYAGVATPDLGNTSIFDTKNTTRLTYRRLIIIKEKPQDPRRNLPHHWLYWNGYNSVKVQVNDKGDVMLTNIGTITVQVTDQDKALEFYTQKLGFETRADMPMGPEQRWIEVAPPGAHTRILLYKATSEAPGADSYEAAKTSIGKSTGMVLEVEDIEATFAKLKSNGVPIKEEPQKQPWGWWGEFADQDGNTYGVHQ